MKLKSIELIDLKPFRFANISRFKMTTSDITVLSGTNGSGKQIVNGTLIKVPGGWTKVEDLKVGDIVTAWDGTPSKVTGVYPQGKKATYRVLFTDGRYLDAGAEHLWGVYTGVPKDDPQYHVINTIAMMNTMSTGRIHVPLPMSEVETHQDRVHELNELLGDTFNGQFGDQQAFTFYPSSDDQAHRVRSLLRSFGWLVHQITNLNDEIVGLIAVPVKVRTDVGRALIGVTSIERLNGKQECTCIAIDHPDKLYIAGDWVVTHNTSLLSEVAPLPAVRTTYHKEGRKRMVLSHGSKEYVLTSDFTNRTSPHSFECEGVELNTSGTTAVQTELVQKHFGYSPQIHDLIYCNVDFTRLGAAERKNFFLNINPVNLTHLVAKHKGVTSKLKEYKSSLATYHARRTELEAKLLSGDVRERTARTRDTLVEDLSVLDKLIFALGRHVGELRSKIQGRYDASTPTPQVKEIYRYAMRFLSEHTGCRSDNFEEVLRKHQLDLSTLQYTLQEKSKAADDIRKELDEFNNHLQAATSGALVKAEEELVHLDKAIADTRVDEKLILFTVAEIDSLRPLMSTLGELCGCMIPPRNACTPAQYTKLRMCLQRCTDRVRGMTSDVSVFQQRCVDTEKELSMLQGKISSACTLSDCFLRNTHDQNKLKLETSLIDINKTLSTVTARSQRYTRVVQKLNEMVEEQAEFHAKYRTLSSMRQSCLALYKAMSEEELYTTLKTQPSRVVQHLDVLINNSLSNHKKLGFLEKKSVLVKELEVLAKSNEASSTFMKKRIDEKEAQLNQLIVDIKSTEKSMQDIRAQISVLDKYSSLLDKLELLSTQVKEGSDTMITTKAIEYFQQIQHICERLKSDKSHDLRDIETQMKEQEALLIRHKEVQEWIAKIDQDKWKLELIATALNPNTGLPSHILHGFIKVVIHNTNYLLGKIFTYRLRLKNLNEKSTDVDFSFPVELEGGIIINDIRQLSKGQREAVVICMSLAILIQLGKLDDTFLILDEIGGALDPIHSGKLISLLRSLLDDGALGQLFLVNHNDLISSAFSDCDVVILKEEGSILPPVYNQNVEITR